MTDTSRTMLEAADILSKLADSESWGRLAIRLRTESARIERVELAIAEAERNPSFATLDAILTASDSGEGVEP